MKINLSKYEREKLEKEDIKLKDTYTDDEALNLLDRVYEMETMYVQDNQEEKANEYANIADKIAKQIPD